MSLVTPLLCALILSTYLLAACGEDSTAASGGGSAGEGGAAATTAGSGGDAATTASSAAATASAATTATSSSSGGGGGGASACDEVQIGDGEPVLCEAAPAGASPLGDTTACTADTSRAWPAKIWGVDVTAGDCLHMRADNAGSAAGADLFGAIVDPGGKSLLFDEEADCTVANPEGYACPEGAVTIETTGRAYVVVGAWEGEGCPPETTTPLQLVVGRNGDDVDLTGSFVCEADLLEVIP